MLINTLTVIGIGTVAWLVTKAIISIMKWNDKRLGQLPRERKGDIR